MCNWKSYIVTSDLKVHGSLKTDSHLILQNELGLKDHTDENAILTRDFIKIEVTPKQLPILNRDLANFVYTEDEEKTLPQWYLANKLRIQEAVMMQLAEDLKVQVILKDETVQSVEAIFVFFCAGSENL